MPNEEDIYDSDVMSKNKVLSYGFESDSEANFSDDSSNDDFQEKQREKMKNNNADDDDPNAFESNDDDMFASDSENIAIKERCSKTFDFIEFERENELTPEHTRIIEETDLSEDEIKLEAFSIRKEAEAGFFDEDMTQTNASDNDEEPWMEGLDRNDLRKAREAKERQDLKTCKKAEVVNSREELIGTLIGLLDAAETPIDALQRLRPQKRKVKGVKSTESETRKAQVFQITECCEELATNYGVAQVYDFSREQLMRAFKKVSGKGYDFKGIKRSAEEAEMDVETVNTEDQQKIWEFRWIGEPEINGPYSTYEMKYWSQKYFDNKVEIRKCGSNEFTHISTTEFKD